MKNHHYSWDCMMQNDITIIGYRRDTKTAVDYAFYTNRTYFCSIEVTVFPDKLIRISGERVQWESRYNELPDTYPGHTRNIVETSSKEEVGSIEYVGSGEYKINGLIDVCCIPEQAYSFYYNNTLVARIKYLFGNPARTLPGYQTPYYEMLADKRLGENLLMLIAAFPLLLFGHNEQLMQQRLDKRLFLRAVSRTEQEAPLRETRQWSNLSLSFDLRNMSDRELYEFCDTMQRWGWRHDDELFWLDYPLAQKNNYRIDYHVKRIDALDLENRLEALFRMLAVLFPHLSAALNARYSGTETTTRQYFDHGGYYSLHIKDGVVNVDDCPIV